jgi:hypothetical protein
MNLIWIRIVEGTTVDEQPFTDLAGMLLLVRSLFILLKDIYFIPVPLRSMHWNIVYGVEPAIFLFSRFTICFLFRSAPLRRK